MTFELDKDTTSEDESRQTRKEGEQREGGDKFFFIMLQNGQ